jgi:hypothetical protein
MLPMVQATIPTGEATTWQLPTHAELDHLNIRRREHRSALLCGPRNPRGYGRRNNNNNNLATSGNTTSGSPAPSKVNQRNNRRFNLNGRRSGMVILWRQSFRHGQTSTFSCTQKKKQEK